MQTAIYALWHTREISKFSLYWFCFRVVWLYNIIYFGCNPLSLEPSVFSHTTLRFKISTYDCIYVQFIIIKQYPSSLRIYDSLHCALLYSTPIDYANCKSDCWFNVLRICVYDNQHCTHRSLLEQSNRCAIIHMQLQNLHMNMYSMGRGSGKG